MLPIFTIQKVEYQLQGERMSGIRLSKSSVQMPDTVALLLRIRRNNLALTSIFQKKSSLTNGKNSLGDGWWNAPFPGSTIPGVSAKITRFPFPPLSLWSKFPIPILCSNAYEYSFLESLTNNIDVFRTIETEFASTSEAYRYLERRIQRLQQRIDAIPDEPVLGGRDSDFTHIFKDF